MRITGQQAIETAENLGLCSVDKYQDPIQDAASVSLTEAREIMREDPSLIYLDVGLPLLGWAFSRQDWARARAILDIIGPDNEEEIRAPQGAPQFVQDRVRDANAAARRAALRGAQ